MARATQASAPSVVTDTANQPAALADFPELVGFFSYSRDDDEDAKGALSALRDAIQRELRGLLGRSRRELRLWQDKEAIAPGRLWKKEITGAIGEAVFFIPIVTPTVVKSRYCRLEFEAFVERERAMGRSDLVFPILYIRVPELEVESRWRVDPVLSVIGERQYVDWRPLRLRPIDDIQVRQAIENFCGTIVEALTVPMPTAEQRRREEEVRLSREAEARQQEEEARLREAAEKQPRQEAEQQQRAEEAQRAEEERKAEAARQAEEIRKAEEARRAEQERKTEAARKAEEARQAGEARRAEEARKAAAAAAATANADTRDGNVDDKRLVVPSTRNPSRRAVVIGAAGAVIVAGGAGATLWALQPRPLRILNGYNGSSLAFSPDGSMLASGNTDDATDLWSPLTGQLLRSITGAVHSLVFSPDGRMLATTVGGRYGAIRLSSPADGQTLRTLPGESGYTSLAFSSDGGMLAAPGVEDTNITLWDPASGQVLRTLSGQSGCTSVSFSSAWRMLASGSADKTIKLWDPATGQALRPLTGHTDVVFAVAFSPDGRMLASGSNDATVKLWDPASGQLLHSLTGHTGSVQSVAYAPTGRILASGSDDKTVKLWDPANGQVLRTLTGHTAIEAVAFSPDGRMLASGSQDNTIKLWDVSSLAAAR